MPCSAAQQIPSGVWTDNLPVLTVDYLAITTRLGAPPLPLCPLLVCLRQSKRLRVAVNKNSRLKSALTLHSGTLIRLVYSTILVMTCKIYCLDRCSLYPKTKALRLQKLRYQTQGDCAIMPNDYSRKCRNILYSLWRSKFFYIKLHWDHCCTAQAIRYNGFQNAVGWLFVSCVKAPLTSTQISMMLSCEKPLWCECSGSV